MSAAPILRLGADAPGGLTLPAALPTPGQLYGPRGVWTDGRRLAVADTGNHRVLLWHQLPTRDGAPADVVLGQSDATSEGPAAGGTDRRRGLHLPTGVAVLDDSLVVADAWHHRILVWHGWPTDFAAPDVVLGQPDADSVLPNAGGGPNAGTLYWPFGLGRTPDTFWVADTGNRRVLGWHGGVPDASRPADIVLGQPTPQDRDDNRGGTPSAHSFRWPHAVTGDDETLWVADAGDHRVLGWRPVPNADRPADLVLGQSSFTDAAEFKNDPQGPSRMRFPYGVAFDGERLVVSDTSNNRILIWDKAPRDGIAVPADLVLGQPDFEEHGENRWKAVTDDSLCWPYAVSATAGLVAVADSGNNRVVVWRVP